MRKYCKECGQEKTSTGFFCQDCRKKRKAARQKILIVPCCVCGQPVECRGHSPWRSSLAQAQAGKACCSLLCVHQVKQQTWNKSGEALSQYNQNQGRLLKVLNNPMKKSENISRMLATKERNGTITHRPLIQGGNGRAMPIAQKLLADALGWPMEVPIKTAAHMPKGERRTYLAKLNLPTCYKIDIADHARKIGVEVDGASHNGRRRTLDAKKTKYLRALGWNVLHLSNRQIHADLAGCVRTVLSII